MNRSNGIASIFSGFCGGILAVGILSTVSVAQTGYKYHGDLTATGNLQALKTVSAAASVGAGTFLKTGRYPTANLPALSSGDRAIVFDSTRGDYVKWNGSAWSTLGSGASNSLEGNTLVVAASDSIDPTRADASYRCSGSNDQTTINAAIDALASKGGVVKLLEGTYHLTGAVLLDQSNVTLQGAGRSSVLKREFNEPSGANGLIRVGDGSTVFTGLVVRDLSIDGNKAAETTTDNDGIKMTAATVEPVVRDVWVHDCKGDGILVSGASMDRPAVLGCGFNANGGIAVDAVSVSNLTVVSCTSNADFIFLAASGATGLRALSNTVNASVSDAFQLSGSSDFPLLADNRVTDSGDEGFQISGSAYVTASHNQVHQAIGNGFELTSLTDSSFDGNLSVDNGGDGFTVSSVTRLLLSGNRSIVNTGVGYNLASGTGVVLAGNLMNSNDAGAITDSATSTLWLAQFDGTQIVTKGATLSLPGTVNLGGLTANAYIGTDGSKNIVTKTAPVTTEADPLSIHASGGSNTMSQALLAGSNKAYDLGNSTNFFRDLYARKLIAREDLSGKIIQLQDSAGNEVAYINAFGVAETSGADQFNLVTTGQIVLQAGSGSIALVPGSTGAVMFHSHIEVDDGLGGTHSGIYNGSGNPNGVVSALTGGIYLNTAGGAGTTLYVKESSPTSSTGWVGK